MNREEGEAWLEIRGFSETGDDYWTHDGGEIDVRMAVRASGEITWGVEIDGVEEFGSNPAEALARLSDWFVDRRARAHEVIQAIEEVLE